MSVPNSQMLTDTFISNGVQEFVDLVSGVTRFEIFDITNSSKSTLIAADLISASWIEGLPNGFGYSTIVDAVPPALLTNGLSSNGFTFIDDAIDQVFSASTIMGITLASPAVVTTTAAHNLITGDIIQITPTGMTEIAGMEFVVTVTGATTFSIEVDSTGFTAATGGIVRKTTRKSYQPKTLFVTNITQAANAQVTTSIPHKLEVNEGVSFRMPRVTATAWGMFGLDRETSSERSFRVSSIIDSTNFTIDFNTLAETAFVFPGSASQPFTQAQVVPIGELGLGTDRNALNDASFNEKTRGLLLGSSVVGAMGDVMRWIAYKAA